MTIVRRRLRKSELISPLRQRLFDDMTLRRFSQETQRNYLRDVGSFLGRPPDTATADDLRRFQMGQQGCASPRSRR